MTREDVAATLKLIIIDHLGLQEAEVTQDARFVEDLAADSLDLVEMVMEIEDQFKIEIPDDAAETLTTFKSTVDYIAAKKAGD